MIANDLPLIDLHRHLEGNMRLETIIDLARQYNITLPADSPAGLRPYVQITERQPGVMAFLEKFDIPMQVIASTDAVLRISKEAVLDAAAEGIDYIELRFSPLFISEKHELDLRSVVEAVLEGVAQGRESSEIMVNLLGIISRTYGPEKAWQELDALLPYADKLVGLDLAGDEANFPAAWFEKHFDRAIEAGLKITVHAGESAGPDSIWQSIRTLGAQRIGHSLAAIKDRELMDFMFERQIAIEANLTSNVQTSSVADYPSHPLKQFLENGLLASINSDDPGISGIDLRYEFDVAAPKAGLSPEQIRQAQLNALESAFLKPREKKALLEKKQNTGK
jgi:adenosine deaminase